MTYQLIHGDCLEVLPTLQAGSIDAVITDPPYGTTACSWDTVIPFDAMWTAIKHVVKPSAAVVMFGSQPFTSALVMSNPQWFKYAWVWEKSLIGDAMNAKNKPMKKHEDIAVFSSGTTANGSDLRMVYHPQGVKRIDKFQKNRYRLDGQATFKPKRPSHGIGWQQEFTNYPYSILRFDNPQYDSPHPTAKPVALLRYLIRTYTNPGDTVLDFTMGSGSTIVAAIMEGRNAIGIEIDKGYYDIACKRCAEAAAQPRLLDVEPTQPLATQAALLD